MVAAAPTGPVSFAVRIEAQAEALLRMVVLASDAAWARRTAAGDWSAAEVTGHVVEMLSYWAGRLPDLVASPGSSYGRDPDDPDRVRGVQAGADLSRGEAAAAVHHAAREASATLRGLDAAALTVPVIHADRGQETVAAVIEHVLASHMESHVAQVRRALR